MTECVHTLPASGDRPLQLRLRSHWDALKNLQNPAVATGWSPDPMEHGVNKGGRHIIIPADEVDCVEASGNCVRLHVGKAIRLLRETMADLERRLDSERFVRVHRFTIVNRARVRTMDPYVNRERIALPIDGTKRKVGRSL